MSLYVTIFVCLLANFIFSYRGYEAKPTAKLSSIADIIINDMNICNSTRNVVKQSKYLQECGKINLPDKLVNVTDANLNETLCIALYDRYLKIDHCNNGTEEKKTENITVLNNHTMFDGAIDASIKAKQYVPRICTKLTNISSPAIDKIKKIVTVLESTFASYKRHCIDKCVSDSDIINPLCIALGIVDEQLEEKVRLSNGTTKDVNPISPVVPNSRETNDPKIGKTGMSASKNDPTGNTKQVIDAKHTSPVKDNRKENETPKPVSKVVNDKDMISSDNAGSNANPDSKNKKSGSSKPHVPPKNDEIDTAPNPLDESVIPKENNEAANIEKSTTLSEKTRNEDQLDQSLEYNADMTGDNDPVGDLENGEVIDDMQSQIPKQIPPMDNDPIDQKEKIPRLPSMRKEDDSHFYGYVTIIGLIGISAFLIYHHKQKILAMIVEGRRSRGGRGRKRPSTANYRKLDCNLEEAVTSQCNSNVTHVIY